MEILIEKPEWVNEGAKGVTLVLGFFDGIHKGHRAVIHSGVKEGYKTVVLTFKASPSEYFSKPVKYIYPRKHSYEILESLGVDYLEEDDFANLVNIKAEDYLNLIVEKYSPKCIVTGFNHTFGLNKEGNNSLIKKYESKYGYKYISCPPCEDLGKVISSTYIKELLEKGNIEKANKLLVQPFEITSTVIKGMQLGRKLGYPTANMDYPDTIVKIPYGVYKVEALGKPAILNWGVKPTLDGKKEGLEVHIINFDGDLYGQNLSIKILKKIRDERKFDNLEDLKIQIKKDTEECLK